LDSLLNPKAKKTTETSKNDEHKEENKKVEIKAQTQYNSKEINNPFLKLPKKENIKKSSDISDQASNVVELSNIPIIGPIHHKIEKME
jgi:hypothetical protein